MSIRMTPLMTSVIAIIILSAMPALAATVFIPHITGEDADWNSYLLADNLSPLAVNYEVTLYANGNVVYQGTLSTPRYNQSVIDLKSLSPDAQCGQVTYDSTLLNFRAAYESTSGGGLAEFALSGDLYASLGFYFSDYSPTIAWKGIAIANLGDTDVTGKLYALGGGGMLGSADITIPARSRVRGFYTAWLPDVAFEDLKEIVFVGSAPYTTAINISGDGSSSRLLFTMAGPVSDFEIPAVPVVSNITGVWSGMWRSTPDFPDSGDFSMTINQNGQAIAGTMDVLDTECGDYYGLPFEGTYINSVIAFTATAVCQGQQATLQYTQGVVAGDTIAGRYDMTVEGAPYDNGTFTLYRQ